jgi:hypothetical protein
MAEFHDTYNLTSSKFVYIIHNTHLILRINHTQGVTMRKMIKMLLKGLNPVIGTWFI